MHFCKEVKRIKWQSAINDVQNEENSFDNNVLGQDRGKIRTEDMKKILGIVDQHPNEVVNEYFVTDSNRSDRSGRD